MNKIEKMLSGMNKAADIVGGTIGPNGNNVYLYEPPFNIKTTNDGVSIANKIILEDKDEDSGAYYIRNISSQQNDDVGDGTTTVSILLQSIINECKKRPENPMILRESIKESGNKILKILSKKVIKIDKKEIEKVALISAENKELAKLISEIINKLGEKSIINVEDSKTFGTEYEIVSGYEAKAGFMSRDFITDSKTERAIFNDCPVLVCEKRISNLQDLAVIIDKLVAEKITQCVIVCDDIENSLVGVMAINKKRAIFNSLVIKTNGYILKDIAGTTGSTLISDSSGVNFQNIELKHLGKAKKVVSSINKTLFIGDEISSKKYAQSLENSIKNETNQYVVKQIQDRISRLRGGVAILKIGAATDPEREHLRDKAEDAVKATKAALEEGIVEGGGFALWRIAQELKEKTIGDKILKKALIAPLKKIIENSGKDYTEIILKLPQKQGYDAKTNKYVNMIEKGIIDPIKVVRCALENAISEASIFITTFEIITPNETKKD